MDERSVLIFQELIKFPNIQSKDLESKFGLSRRQIGYSFNKINDYLKSGGLPQIEKKRNGRFIIPLSLIANKDVKILERHAASYVLSEKERQIALILILLSRIEELSLLHLASILDVSKNTILNDLKATQILLSSHSLDISYTRQSGYRIIGDEFFKRRLLIDVVSQLFKISNGQVVIKQLTGITQTEVNRCKRKIESIEKKLNIVFTDERIDVLPYQLAFILRRSKLGKFLDDKDINLEEIFDSKEYLLIESILSNLGEIPSNEKLFIALHLLTTNVSSLQLIKGDELNFILNQAIDSMLKLFERNACITLKEKDLLASKILLHTKPAYYRIKYGLTMTCSLNEQLLAEFKELHHLVKKSIAPLTEAFNCHIPEDEVRYYTLLIGGWLARYNARIEDKKKAVIVCQNGVSVSKILEVRLKDLFPEFIFLETLSVREFYKFELDYDFVFSTVVIKSPKKLFVINAFLGYAERESLRKQVMQELFGFNPSKLEIDELISIIEKHAKVDDKLPLIKEIEIFLQENNLNAFPSKEFVSDKLNLCDLIKSENIVLKKSVSTWEDAIIASAEPLLKNNDITSKYVKRMISQYSPDDPYIIIAPGLAIPHASPEDGVKNVGMSLLRLEEPVAFSKTVSVSIVVVIATLDREKHLRALLQLLKLSESSANLQSIIQANTVEQIYEIISNHSVD